jgi:hypothetical protein
VKIRLIMRYGIADHDGRCVKYEYATYIVIVNDYEKIFNDVGNLPEIIGGEWLLNDVPKMSE